jgi:hypothetical protein
VSFISTTAVFGTPVDITLSELALEAFFPAGISDSIADSVYIPETVRISMEACRFPARRIPAQRSMSRQRCNHEWHGACWN